MNNQMNYLKKSSVFLAIAFISFMGSSAFAECEPRDTDGQNAKRLMDAFTKTVKADCGMGSCHLEIRNLNCSGGAHEPTESKTCTFESDKKSYTVTGKDAVRMDSFVREVHGEWLTGRGFLAADSIKCKVSRGDSPESDRYSCTTSPDLAYETDTLPTERRQGRLGQSLKRFFGVTR